MMRSKRTVVDLPHRSGNPRKSLYAYFLRRSHSSWLPLTWRHSSGSAFSSRDLLHRDVGPDGVHSERWRESHHTVLMWPFPHLAIAAVLAEASRRIGRVPDSPLVSTLVTRGCLSSLAVIGTYYSYMLRTVA